MPSRSKSKNSRLRQYLAEKQPACVDEGLFSELSLLLAPVSEPYLRRLLRESGVRLAPMVEGVNLHCLEDLERTLLVLAEEYASGRKEARSAVIEAKDRIRWAVARAVEAEKRAEKDEMLLWIMTWLENPLAFPVWSRLRRRVQFAESEYS